MTISENDNWKEPKVPAILKTVKVVWLLFDEMHLLGTTFLTIPCQTWEDCKPQFLSIPRCILCSFVRFAIRMLRLCQDNIFGKPNLFSAMPDLLSQLAKDPQWLWLSQIPSMTGPHHSSHFCFLDLVLESHCSSVWILANSDENQWNSMKIFKGSYIKFL